MNRQPLPIFVTLIIAGFYGLTFFIPFGDFAIAGIAGILTIAIVASLLAGASAGGARRATPPRR